MSGRTRAIVLVLSLLAAVGGVMATMESRRGESGDGGRRAEGGHGTRDAGGETWVADVADDAAAATADLGAGPDGVAASEADEGPPAIDRFESATDPAGPVVEVASGPDGPLHVTGGGLEGLTPGRTHPLAPGPHRLRLVGGHGAPVVYVVLDSEPPRLDATVSGDGAAALNVKCRGGVDAPEPVTAAVGARLVCWVRGPEGTLTVELRVVER